MRGVNGIRDGLEGRSGLGHGGGAWPTVGARMMSASVVPLRSWRIQVVVKLKEHCDSGLVKVRTRPISIFEDWADKSSRLTKLL